MGMEKVIEEALDDDSDEDMGVGLFDDILPKKPKAEDEAETVMPAPKKPRIEPESEVKVTCHIFEDHLITPPNYPPFKLRSLINVAYANEADLSRICERSSCSSPNGEGESLSNNSGWSQFFTEDGHLRFDLILSLLPPVQFTREFVHAYKQDLESIQMALTSYNRNKGTEYELVAPILSACVFAPRYFLVRHVNFLAKLKHADSPVKVFFAEVAAVRVRPGLDKVIKCSILPPQNSSVRSSRGCCTTDPLSILHPEEEDCPYCIQHLASSTSDSD